jgi:hypothetical protein
MVLTADAWVRTSRSDVGATADAQVRGDATSDWVALQLEYAK